MGDFFKSNVYVMMDALVDVDLGLILTMKEKFPNNRYMEYDIYKYSINQMKYVLLTRKYENPLCLLMWDYADDLYDELYDKYRDDIYKNSVFTNIINMFITTKRLDDIAMTVVCKDIKDKHFIDTHSDILGTYKTILLQDVEFKTSDYIFVNKTRDIIHRNDIDGTNLYIFRSMYNLQYNKKENIYEMRPHIEELCNYSVVKFLSPYIMDDSYIIKEDDK